VLAGRGAPVLGLIDPERDSPAGLLPVGRCAIEPAEHALIYREIARWLEHPAATEFARALRYVIVRGASAEHALILNVRALNPALTRAANLLSRAVTAKARSVNAVFLHHEAEEERYYMGKASFRSGVHTRKLFGKAEHHLDLGGRRFLFSPLSFSQVNVSLLPALTAAAGELLDLTRTTTLYDLYCGYGLFGLSLADRAGHVVGIEASPVSVAAAIANARRLRASNVRFHRTEITEESLAQRTQGMDDTAAVLLDPPRNGTAPGVIDVIAGQCPSRVLHLFCNIDLVPAELDRWKGAGYAVARAIPFDMFPGTATVEVMVLLKPVKGREAE
jgi:tRNA/tmRNA/rRNA uracil-C5-methylase (TrmA/RlmC/RlmD family)